MLLMVEHDVNGWNIVLVGGAHWWVENGVDGWTWCWWMKCVGGGRCMLLRRLTIFPLSTSAWL